MFFRNARKQPDTSTADGLALENAVDYIRGLLISDDKIDLYFTMIYISDIQYYMRKLGLEEYDINFDYVYTLTGSNLKMIKKGTAK